VVTFYRGVWCPYCNMDLQALEAARPEIESRGASLVALSMQNASNSRKSGRDNHLGFPILVDYKGQVADRFGLRFKLSDELVDVYKQFGNDLAQINGEPSWMLPMPARYVIDQGGAVAYAEVNPDYTKRPDPSDLPDPRPARSLKRGVRGRAASERRSDSQLYTTSGGASRPFERYSYVQVSARSDQRICR
jgi:peroxiredoxin